MNSSGDITRCVVASRRGAFSFSTARPAVRRACLPHRQCELSVELARGRVKQMHVAVNPPAANLIQASARITSGNLALLAHCE